MDSTVELINTIFSFSRCMREKSGTKSEIAHMSMVQIQTLVFLAKNKFSSMKDIAVYLHIELPSATNLIEHLQEAGFIKRETDIEDKRVTKISLTKKGEDFLQKTKKERKDHIETLLQVLTTDEKKQLLVIMQKLTQHEGGQHEK